ncbi:MAG: hypothetical protein HYZ39_16365 [Mycolicibacterium cosmeticum]|nr:hypothetical protein [Mycolicibacterium cosmeticum]
MSAYRDKAMAAWREGRAAAIGDSNPYAGTGTQADMWMQGYKAMLWAHMSRSPALQPFINKPE